MHIRSWVTGALCLTVLACAPKLTRRYKSADLDITVLDASRAFDVSVFMMNVPSSVKKSLFDLDGRGQAALISAVSGPNGFPAGASWNKELGKDIAYAPSKPTVDERTLKRRVVVNLVHRPITQSGDDLAYRPADRVAWAEAVVALPDGPGGFQEFEVIGYDKIDTGFETIDLGKVTRTASFSVTGEASFSPTGTSSSGRVVGPTEWDNRTSGRTATNTGNVGVSATGGETLGEEIGVKRKIVTLSVRVADDGQALHIVRQGERGVDLTGSLTIDVVFRTKSPLSDARHTFEAPPPPGNAVILAETTLLRPQAEALELAVFAEALIRRVKKNARTTVEYDDAVSFELARAEARAPSSPLPGKVAFSLAHASNGAALHVMKGQPCTPDRRAIDVCSAGSTPTGTPTVLRFQTVQQAEAFVVWLHTHPAVWATFDTLNEHGFHLVTADGAPFPDPASTWATRLEVVAQ